MAVGSRGPTKLSAVRPHPTLQAVHAHTPPSTTSPAVLASTWRPAGRQCPTRPLPPFLFVSSSVQIAVPLYRAVPRCAVLAAPTLRHHSLPVTHLSCTCFGNPALLPLPTPFLARKWIGPFPPLRGPRQLIAPLTQTSGEWLPARAVARPCPRVQGLLQVVQVSREPGASEPDANRPPRSPVSRAMFTRHGR